jgi:catechol 2,3-dioxygenase-like lactoylglutathione lyase family enzyme
MSRLSAISMFVTDVSRSTDWYRTVFDLPIEFQDDESTALRFENTIINLLGVGAAVDLVAPRTPAVPGTQPQVQFSLWIDDVDAFCSQLAAKGVALVNGPLDRPWGLRTACFADPDGHVWEVAHPLS